jgi:hypothetical protein
MPVSAAATIEKAGCEIAKKRSIAAYQLENAQRAKEAGLDDVADFHTRLHEQLSSECDQTELLLKESALHDRCSKLDKELERVKTHTGNRAQILACGRGGS